MVILRVACDNFYMFKDFNLDFTYNERIVHPISQHDVLFEGSHIKVRKNLIVMGGNASGKTTFGKLLCMIMNFICGTYISDNEIKLNAAQYDKNKNATFEIEFVIDDVAYLLQTEFNNGNLKSEKLFIQTINKSYDIKTLRETFKNSKPFSDYNSDKSDINAGAASYIFSLSKHKQLTELRGRIGFSFKFSEFELNAAKNELFINVDFINDLLPKIDNSVESVKKLETNDLTISKSYLIKFKNGETLTVPEGDLNYCKERLSHGTREAINLSILFKNLSSTNIFYMDEQLAHMHSELEAYLIRQAFLKKADDAQLFFTTHNIELLELNVPINSFVFFVRNKEGFNEAIYPSEKLNKNDRNLRNYYENDYFGILPDYSVLDELFEENEDE